MNDFMDRKTSVVALVGFVTATIVTKNATFIIGIAVAAAIILINTIDAVKRVKTLDEWERELDEREMKLHDKEQSIQKQEWNVQIRYNQLLADIGEFERRKEKDGHEHETAGEKPFVVTYDADLCAEPPKIIPIARGVKAGYEDYAVTDLDPEDLEVEFDSNDYVTISYRNRDKAMDLIRLAAEQAKKEE